MGSTSLFRFQSWLTEHMAVRSTFNQVLELIKDDIATEEMMIGHHTLSARAQLLLVLWYFATPDSYRSICGRFDIGKATGLRSVRRVANALSKKSSIIIKWPTGVEYDQVVAGFAAKGFPNTVGAIDGCHIEIPKPKEHGVSYINRHGYSSILLQAVCDHNLKYVDCYVGEVGSCHDAKVLTRSDIWNKINYQQNIHFPNDTHLIGDKAYPCLPQLQCPYKDNGHLTNAQKHFNMKFSSARSTVERSFALLKGRFRCLKYLDVRKLEWAPKYILACCVLHNICSNNGDHIDIDFIEEQDIEDIPDINRRQLQIVGQLKRDRICAELYNAIN
ncbi:hypothetical protein JTB14_035663 [Gonioctena quinquepunctata]|nr:hypothetical protein JTB14_035663 [Gonioctena quinquepunctata]